MQFNMVGGIAIILGLHSSVWTTLVTRGFVERKTMNKFRQYIPAVLAAASALSAGSLLGGQQPKDPKTYSLKPTPKTVAWGYYDAATPPALRVQSGDTVEVQTLPAGVSPEQLEAAGA